MAAPTGAASGKWNTLVNAVVTRAAQQVPPIPNATSATVDAWLNAMWINPAAENDRNDLRAMCVAFLEANVPNAPTLPRALKIFASA